MVPPNRRHATSLSSPDVADIHSLKAALADAEVRLADAEDRAHRFRSALDKTPVCVFIKDRDLRYTYANPATLAVLGRLEADVLGQGDMDLFTPETASTVVGIDRAVLGGLTSGREVHTQVPGQGTRTYWDVKAPIYASDGSGEIVGLSGVTSDITELRHAREAIETVEKQHIAILKTAMDGFWLADAEGRLLEVNEAYCSMSGYTGAELLEMRISDLDANEEPEDTARRIATIIERGEARFESQQRRKDGSLFDVEVSVQYRPDHGGRFVTFLRDITERRRADMRVAASLREKEGLLKEIHHRVKNNLQIITSLLRLENGRTDNDATHQVLGDMQSRILAMAQLHETLYRSGQFGYVDLAQYLDNLTRQFIRAQGSQDGAVRLSLDLRSVRVDLDQAIPCGLIVSELLTNCLKHAFPAGGSGTVSVSLLPLSDGAVRLSVADDGLGLPEDFELRRSRSLGLQLVRDLAHQLSGSLAVGPGAVFNIVFTPRVPAGA